MQLLIYASKLTPRINYIFNFIFKDILKIDADLSTDEAAFLEYNGPKFSYGLEPSGDALFFKQDPLLLKTLIEEIAIETTTFGGLKVPFPVAGSALPFDIFAASFYFISRYEEYLHTKQHNSPFLSTNSLQKRLNLLDKPVIDDWALLIKNLLLKRYPDLKFGDKAFVHFPSINVQLQTPKPTGLIKRTAYLLNALFKPGERKQLFDELTGLGDNQDQNISYLNTTFKNKQLTPFYFIGIVPDDGTADNCKSFISKLKTAANIGFLNPCPDAENRQNITNMVCLFDQLQISNYPLTQQLGGFSMPRCYLQLLNGGIAADFSMGYQDVCGFRAGTCTPFAWYDLQLERVSALKIYPYAISDNALQLQTFSDAEKTYKQLIDSVKFVNGTFCSSWALKSLSENVKFKKWKQFYESILNYAGN